LKFLIVGLGSMGKRRIRNLKHLNQNDVIGFDISEERCKEVSEKYGIKTFDDISNALEEQPNAMIISTPPDQHMKYAKIAIQKRIHFFTEASVVQEEMDDVINSLHSLDLVGLPSCTLRYHPIVLHVNDILNSGKIGKPLSFLYHSGQYLPDWHPWEDYRNYYVSKRGTGACREIVPFELVWITQIFGEIGSVSAFKRKVSKLDVDIDDIYSIIFEFKNTMMGNLTVDVITRVPYRQLKILGEDGVILADWLEKSLKYFRKETGWTNLKVDDGLAEKNYIYGEQMYVTEMENFIKAIKKEIKQPYTFEEDLKILKILDAIEKSSDLGIVQHID